MKKSMKMISILMISLMLIMSATPVFAKQVGNYSISVNEVSNQDASDILGLVGKILGFLQFAAIILAVLIIAILGIKYMMGSLEEKAEYKKSMVPLIVGIVVVASAITIANILFKTFTL